jgi:hypothetical protein
MDSVKYYKTNTEKTHILIYVLMGFFFFLFLAAAILIHILLGIVLAIVTYLVITSKTGVEIDVTNNRYRMNLVIFGREGVREMAHFTAH